MVFQQRPEASEPQRKSPWTKKFPVPWTVYLKPLLVWLQSFGATAGTIFGGISAACVRLAGRELAEVAGPLCGGADPGVTGITEDG